jgi:hypothetical protein
MIVPELTNEAYHADPSISASAVKTVAQKSLAHWRYSERKHLAAFDFGTACHTLVLEPHLSSAVRCGPETRRGKAWSEAKSEAEDDGAVLLPEAEYRHAVALSGAVRAHPEVAKLLTADAEVESSIFANDPETGLDLRCRPDAWRRDIDAVIDLKTTIDASPSAFASSCARFGYHIQDQFYRKVLGLEGHAISRFIFIAVEKEPPFATGVYELDSRALLEGSRAIEDVLPRIAAAQEDGSFTTGLEGLQMLSLPGWAFRYTDVY